MCVHCFAHHRVSLLAQFVRLGFVAGLFGLVNLLSKLLHLLTRFGNFFIAWSTGTVWSAERIARHLSLELLAHFVELLAYLGRFILLACLFQLAHLAMKLGGLFKLLAELPHFFWVGALTAGRGSIAGRRAIAWRRAVGASFTRWRATFATGRPISQARPTVGTILAIRGSQHLAGLLGQIAGLTVIPIGGRTFGPLDELPRLVGRVLCRGGSRPNPQAQGGRRQRRQPGAAIKSHVLISVPLNRGMCVAKRSAPQQSAASICAI